MTDARWTAALAVAGSLAAASAPAWGQAPPGPSDGRAPATVTPNPRLGRVVREAPAGTPRVDPRTCATAPRPGGGPRTICDPG